jgi:hypothetical protein
MNLNQPLLVLTLTSEARRKPRWSARSHSAPTMKAVSAVKRSEVERRYAEWIQREGAVRSQIAWE